MIQNMIIKSISFNTIQPIWANNLWPGRTSAIEPYSAMMFMNATYDSGFSTRPCKFLAGLVDDKIVAVNSIHLSETYMARSRGLWVDPMFRGNKYGVQILNESARLAEGLGASAIWSFSRQLSIRTYQAAGYIKTSPWMDHGEFGPNCYVIKGLL